MSPPADAIVFRLVHQSHGIELKVPGQSMRDPSDRRDLNDRDEAEDRKVLATIAISAANRGRRIAPAQRVRPRGSIASQFAA
jgi:hypothetical protein